MYKITRPRDRFIFNMGIPKHEKDALYIESGLRTQILQYWAIEMPKIDFEEEDRNTLYCIYELWE